MSTPDIFISYARGDAKTAECFADAFTSEGFDVWWDNALQTGEVFDEAIEAALRAAKAVVVLWSPESVVSRWVRAEATEADRNGTLVPVTITACRKPVIFELTQTADLSHWHGAASDPAWQTLLGHVRHFVGQDAASPATRPKLDLPHRDRVSLVVLPFENMSRDEDQEYFSDGITEDIITDLSKVSALSVIARNTAFTFKGKHVDIGEVARQLGVSHVLEGSVRKAGNRVRVTAQLIDGSAGDHLWAERYDRDLDDIFELQDELSQEIVKALKIKLLPEEKEAIEKRSTASLEAYDTYLRARSAANAALSPEGFWKAEELFHETLEIDPHFAPALSGIALMYHRLLAFAPHRHDDIMRRLDALCERAVALSPEDWGSQVLRATQAMIARRWREALELYEQAMAAAPAFDTDVAGLFGFCLGNVGRITDAIRVLEVARETDPYNAFAFLFLQRFYAMAGRPEDAEADYRRSYDMVGRFYMAQQAAFFRSWMKGDIDEAKRRLRLYLEAQDEPMPVMVEYLEVIDQPETALAILRNSIDDPANQEWTRLFSLAGHLSIQGDGELAIALMRRGLTELDSYSSFFLWSPFFSDARRLPAFKQLMRDIGLYEYWRQSGNWGDFAAPIGDDDFEIIA